MAAGDKQYQLQLPPELMRKAKARAALGDKTLRQLVIDALTEYLQRKPVAAEIEAAMDSTEGEDNE